MGAKVKAPLMLSGDCSFKSFFIYFDLSSCVGDSTVLGCGAGSPHEKELQSFSGTKTANEKRGEVVKYYYCRNCNENNLQHYSSM